jgi:hypothetical protein
MPRPQTTVALLSTSALLLLALLWWSPQPAPAQVVSREGDFVACSFPTATGSDALYVADTRAGLLAVIMYDPASGTLQPRAVRRLADAFMPLGLRQP